MEYKLATTTWGDEELEAINRVIESGMFSMGGEVKQYEKDFAKAQKLAKQEIEQSKT